MFQQEVLDKGQCARPQSVRRDLWRVDTTGLFQRP